MVLWTVTEKLELSAPLLAIHLLNSSTVGHCSNEANSVGALTTTISAVQFLDYIGPTAMWYNAFDSTVFFD